MRQNALYTTVLTDEITVSLPIAQQRATTRFISETHKLDITSSVDKRLIYTTETRVNHSLYRQIENKAWEYLGYAEGHYPEMMFHSHGT